MGSRPILTKSFWLCHFGGTKDSFLISLGGSGGSYTKTITWSFEHWELNIFLLQFCLVLKKNKRSLYSNEICGLQFGTSNTGNQQNNPTCYHTKKFKLDSIIDLKI